MTSPKNIDGNEIISEISSGGHAVVYKAWDSVLETYYAIKNSRDSTRNSAYYITILHKIITSFL